MEEEEEEDDLNDMALVEEGRAKEWETMVMVEEAESGADNSMKSRREKDEG